MFINCNIKKAYIYNQINILEVMRMELYRDSKNTINK